MTLPERLVKIREEHGYTRKRLCEELGRPYATVTKYENGERDPGHSYIVEIAQKFGVTTDYILGTEECELQNTQKEDPPRLKFPNMKDPVAVFDWIEELLVSNGYKKPGEDISEKDANFLVKIIGLIDDYFGE